MIIEGNSVAECWMQVLKTLVSNKASEISPLIVKIHNTNERPFYSDDLEIDINNFLRTVNQPPIETTAGTIFPVSLAGGAESIFDRYQRIWRYIKHDSKNRRGTYFHRMVSYRDKNGGGVNQLEHIINTYNGIPGKRNPVHRKSALIATIFDPEIDHTPQPQLGFPCLQQVCFVPQSGAGMHMNAIYAMQHLSTRAYGNYLGLMRLGRFMGDHLGLRFDYMNCMISTLSLGQMKKIQAKEIVKKYL